MKLLRRFILGLLIALLALTLALAASIPLDHWLNQGRVASLTNLDIFTSSGVTLRASSHIPTSDTSLPAIIMIHEFWGLKPSIIEKAEALAAEGYVVIAPDTFKGQSTSWLPRAIWQTTRVPEDRVFADLDAVVNWLKQQDEVDPERIMIMGFCYGGRTALRYSLHRPTLAATGIFYGSPVADAEALGQLEGPVLGIFGREDSSIPLQHVETFRAQLEALNIPHEITIYDGVGHAFVQSVAGIQQGGQQAAAWNQLLSFAEHYLQNP